METITSIFENQELLKIDLRINEIQLQKILIENQEEVQKLSQMKDEYIKEKIKNSKINNGVNIDLYIENLLYIKQSSFIMQKDSNADFLDIEMIKQLQIKDIIEKLPSNDSDGLNITFDELNKLAIQKLEQREKWNEYNIKSTISNKLSIDENNIEFISKLSDYVSFVSNLKSAEEYVSRGQKDCGFDLLPSLFRNHKNDYSIHQSAYEGSFKQKILYYDNTIANKSEETLRAEGQHFGLPTNYLDFTEAHLISLLFAIEEYEYKDNHSIIYFINSLEYNSETIGQKEKLIDYSIQSNIDSINKKYENSRSYFIKLGNSNERIHFQKGCFLKFSAEDKDVFNQKIKDFCKVVIINKDCKKDILIELFNLGITFENIYPDKDNVVKSIKFQHNEMAGRNN